MIAEEALKLVGKVSELTVNTLKKNQLLTQEKFKLQEENNRLFEALHSNKLDEETEELIQLGKYVKQVRDGADWSMEIDKVKLQKINAQGETPSDRSIKALERKLHEIRQAWVNPGPDKIFHRQMKERVKRQMPVLAGHLDDLASDTRGNWK